MKRGQKSRTKREERENDSKGDRRPERGCDPSLWKKTGGKVEKRWEIEREIKEREVEVERERERERKKRKRGRDREKEKKEREREEKERVCVCVMEREEDRNWVC